MPAIDAAAIIAGFTAAFLGTGISCEYTPPLATAARVLAFRLAMAWAKYIVKHYRPISPSLIRGTCMPSSQHISPAAIALLLFTIATDFTLVIIGLASAHWIAAAPRHSQYRGGTCAYFTYYCHTVTSRNEIEHALVCRHINIASVWSPLGQATPAS